MTALIQKVAHRGGSALAPENTLAAFHHALTFPIDAIEFDVQMSRDGHPVVFHDETVERLTNGQGNILDLDLAYLRSLNAAEHFPGGWSQPQQIPTLREVLELARQGDVGAFIEIKPSQRAGGLGRYPGIAEAVAREVLLTGMVERSLIISFDWQILPAIKALIPGVQTGMLVNRDVWNPHASNALSSLAAQVKSLQCEWIDLDNRLFTEEMPAFFHARGLQLSIWTVNDPARLEYLERSKVDALTTDRLDLLE